MRDQIRVLVDTNILVPQRSAVVRLRRLVDRWYESPTFDVIACPHRCADSELLLGRPRPRRFVTIEVADFLIDTMEALAPYGR